MEKLSFKIKIKLNKNENTIWEAFAFVGCKLILQLKLMAYISFNKILKTWKKVTLRVEMINGTIVLVKQIKYET